MRRLVGISVTLTGRKASGWVKLMSPRAVARRRNSLPHVDVTRGLVWLEEDGITVRRAGANESASAFEGFADGDRKFCGHFAPAAEVVKNQHRPRGSPML
jgi:hypothetical protein